LRHIRLWKWLIIGSDKLLSNFGLHVGIGKTIENASNFAMWFMQWTDSVYGIAMVGVMFWLRKRAADRERAYSLSEQIARTIDRKLGKDGSANADAAPVTAGN